MTATTGFRKYVPDGKKLTPYQEYLVGLVLLEVCPLYSDLLKLAKVPSRKVNKQIISAVEFTVVVGPIQFFVVVNINWKTLCRALFDEKPSHRNWKRLLGCLERFSKKHYEKHKIILLDFYLNGRQIGV